MKSERQLSRKQTLVRPGWEAIFFSVTEYVTQQKYIYVYILESRIIGVTPRVVMTWTELVQLVIKLHMFSLELQQH